MPGHETDGMQDGPLTLAEAERFLLTLPPHVLLEPGAHPLIVQSYILAAEAHDGQTRKSGEPYFTHPVAVVGILVSIHPEVDAQMVCAALLHDVIEDSEFTQREVAERTEPAVARLVDGLTKINLQGTSHTDEERTFAKFKESAKKDRRLYYLKFADLLHNLSTLHQLHPDRMRRYARQALEKYVPLAREIKEDHIAQLIEKSAKRYLVSP